MTKKPTILFLSRPRLDSFYMNMIKELKETANIVVLLYENSSEEFFNIEGIEVIRDASRAEMAEKIKTEGPELLKEVQQVEQELGLNCYASNINYMLYEMFVSRYARIGGHRFQNINAAELFIIRYKQLKELVAKYNIEYCFFEMIDLAESFIIDAMVKKGILKQHFVQSLVSVGGELRVRLTSGTYSRSPILKYLYDTKSYSEESRKWAEESTEKAKLMDVASSYDRFKRSKGSVLPRYTFDQVVTKFKALFDGESLRPAVIRIFNRVLSNKYFTSEIGDKKNIAVFLQVVPEAGLMSEVPEHAHQEALIEQMALYGKYGYNILVKEHPSGYGNNPHRMFKELSLLPNVVLLPPSYPTREVLLKSEAVVVATGTTVGVEALMMGVPLIAVGHPYFDVCKNVINIKQPKDIWDVIPDIKFDKEDGVRFFASLHESSYAYPKYVSDEHYEEGKDSAPVLCKALRREIALYEEGILPYTPES